MILGIMAALSVGSSAIAKTDGGHHSCAKASKHQVKHATGRAKCKKKVRTRGRGETDATKTVEPTPGAGSETNTAGGTDTSTVIGAEADTGTTSTGGGTTTSAPPETPEGWLSGAIHFASGPDNPEEQDAPHQGWVHILSRDGAVVSVTQVQGAFKIEVPEGAYTVFATRQETGTAPEDGCPRESVELYAGQSTEVILAFGCDIK